MVRRESANAAARADAKRADCLPARGEGNGERPPRLRQRRRRIALRVADDVNRAVLALDRAATRAGDVLEKLRRLGCRRFLFVVSSALRDPPKLALIAVPDEQLALLDADGLSDDVGDADERLLRRAPR